MSSFFVVSSGRRRFDIEGPFSRIGDAWICIRCFWLQVLAWAVRRLFKSTAFRNGRWEHDVSEVRILSHMRNGELSGYRNRNFIATVNCKTKQWENVISLFPGELWLFGSKSFCLLGHGWLIPGA